MGIKELIERILPKKRVPIKIPVDRYDVQRDEYLMGLMDELESLDRLDKKNKTVDADMYDKL